MKQQPMQPQSSLPRFCASRNPSRAPSAGFTLLEMVICIIILGIVFSYAGMTIVAYVQKDQQQRTTSQLLQSGEYALTKITRTLAFNCTQLKRVDNTLILYKDTNNPGTKSIIYTASGPGMDSQLMMNGYTLLGYVSSAQFTFLNSNAIPFTSPPSDLNQIKYITITFTLTKDNVNQTFTQTAFLRNLS